jgi:hypothetical protein
MSNKEYQKIMCEFERNVSKIHCPQMLLAINKQINYLKNKQKVQESHTS